MFELRGFRGLRFDGGLVGGFENVVTPPFDVINGEDREVLGALSPFNMVHVILPSGDDPGAAAAGCFEDWLGRGVVRRDEEEGYYLCRQNFRDRDGVEHSRTAFYGLAKIPEEGEDLVLGHERTFAHKIEGRLGLLRATGVQPGGVFVLYGDPDGVVRGLLDGLVGGEPDIDVVTIDGVRQRFWRLPVDPRLAEFMAEQRVYIGDGHHRFATAVAYRNERRAAGARAGGAHEYIMLGFVAFEDPGLLVYPAHRVVDEVHTPSAVELVGKLSPYFDVRAVKGSLTEALAAAEDGTQFGVVMRGGEQFVATLKPVDRVEFLGDDHGPSWRDLDVAVLHRGVFEKLLGMDAGAELIYEPDPNRAIALCREPNRGMTWLMEGASSAQLRACADGGEFMPQKATYLFPKLPTGGVMYLLGDGD